MKDNSKWSECIPAVEIKKPGSEVPRAVSEIPLDAEAKPGLKPTSSFSTGPSVPATALPCRSTQSGADILMRKGKCRQICGPAEGQVSIRHTRGHPSIGPRGNSGYSHFIDRLCHLLTSLTKPLAEPLLKPWLWHGGPALTRRCCSGSLDEAVSQPHSRRSLGEEGGMALAKFSRI